MEEKKEIIIHLINIMQIVFPYFMKVQVFFQLLLSTYSWVWNNSN